MLAHPNVPVCPHKQGGLSTQMCQSVHTNKAVCPHKHGSLSTQMCQSVHTNKAICPPVTNLFFINQKQNKKEQGKVPENSFTSHHENNERSPAKRWWRPRRQFVWQGSQVWAQQRSQAPFSFLPSGKHLSKIEWHICICLSAYIQTVNSWTPIVYAALMHTL